MLDVVSPQGDQVFEVGDGNKAELHIEANADDGEGWGIANVELLIAPEDGDMVAQSLTYAPFRWNTAFPVGGYNLKLIATDNAGNITESEWIAVGVGAEPPESPPGDDDTGGAETGDDGETGVDDADDGNDEDEDEDDGDDDDASDGDAPPIDGDDDAGGCSIATRPRDAAPWMIVGLVVGVFARRRTTRARVA